MTTTTFVDEVTVIEASWLNDVNADVYGVRPVATGGTGATDAADARTNLGLGNVDNTSDANKPVSTAQQAALNLKANLVSPSFTTPSLGVATATSLQGIIGNITPAAGTFTTLTSTGNAALGDAEASDTHAIKGATTLLANSASAALTVTQTGAGNAFVVEDSASTDSTPFVIDGTGNVGIGIAPSYKFHIETAVAGSQQYTLRNSDTGASSFSILNIGNDASATQARFLVGSAASSAWAGQGLAISVTGANPLTLWTNSTEAMRIDSTQSISNTAAGSGTNAYGFRVTSAKTGGTNNYAFSGEIAAGTNRYNLYMSGTADNYFAGSVGIGAVPVSTIKNYVFATVSAASTGEYAGYFQLSAANTTGSSTKIGLFGSAASAAGSTANTLIGVQGDAYQNAAVTTTQLIGVSGRAYTLAAGTVSQMYGFSALIANTGAATVTNTYGFYMPDHTVGTNNYGFYSNMAAGANKYGFYAAGTADNYFAGKITCGTTVNASSYVHGAVTVATPAGGAIAFAAGTSAMGVYFGSGAPTVSAAKGSLYLRSDGSTTNDRMYVNTNGSTTWTAVTTVA